MTFFLPSSAILGARGFTVWCFDPGRTLGAIKASLSFPFLSWMEEKKYKERLMGQDEGQERYVSALIKVYIHVG